MGRAWRDQVVESWALVVCSFGHVFRANSQNPRIDLPGLTASWSRTATV